MRTLTSNSGNTTPSDTYWDGIMPRPTPHHCDPRALAAGCCHTCEGDGDLAWMAWEHDVEPYLIPGDAVDLDLVVLDLTSAIRRQALTDALNARPACTDPF